MKLEEIQKILKGSNHTHKMKLYARKTTGGKVVIWVYCNYERKSLALPPLVTSNQGIRADEMALLKKAISRRDELELQAGGHGANRKQKVSKIGQEWVEHYTTDSSHRNAGQSLCNFIEANGDMPVGTVSRQHILKMMDAMQKNGYHTNYIRSAASRIRAFCNWAEQRGYMDRVDTRRLLPAEVFGEVKALSEDEIKRLVSTPISLPDVKDLFLLGVYTAQRVGEIMKYTFSLYYDKQIRARQGKTGKFIVIPLSDGALAVMEGLRQRRASEGMSTEPNAPMFRLPSGPQICKAFRDWLAAAGIPKGKVTLHNSRSTAISLLINKGVPESVTQELANHSDPKTTARYYRQIDDSKKREALAKIPVF